MRIHVLALLCAFAAPAAADLVVTIYEDGPDVQMDAGGSLDLTGMVKEVRTDQGGPGVFPGESEPFSFFGFGTPGDTDFYFDNDLIDGPGTFGFGPVTGALGTGDTFTLHHTTYDTWPGCEFCPAYSQIHVPVGYTSGSPLNGTATFANHSIASLGLTPGTYVWSWPTDSITLNVGASAVPEPSSFALLGLVASLGYLFRRRLR